MATKHETLEMKPSTVVEDNMNKEITNIEEICLELTPMNAPILTKDNPQNITTENIQHNSSDTNSHYSESGNISFIVYIINTINCSIISNQYICYCNEICICLTT